MVVWWTHDPSIELPFCQPLNDLSSLVILLGVEPGSSVHNQWPPG
uniref:Uncharacterized protein n=1 Tax=Anguilla anguilla TaxID=7936 RepID=A0A0E9V2M0_ANGAN